MKVETREFVLGAYGKNRTEAIATIFTKLKKDAYSSVDGLIIHMEPEDVILVKEEEKSRVQKFLGFFSPRIIQDYYVELKIVAIIKFI